MLRALTLGLALGLAGFSAACTTADDAAPAYDWSDASHDERIAELLSQMSVEHKVAQLIMPDISTISPEDVRTYRFGAILNGGNSGPGGDDLAATAEWLALADAFWEASVAPLPGDEPVIPTLWATDAVHGHSNIPGATIFPHNVGLGATRNAELVRRIGEATATEIAVTGIDWTFAPTLAVATDDRWGRTYESFSEDPDLVSALGEATILGLQGDPESEEFLDQRHVIATAKHFFGDGGTGGLDRGDTRGDLEEIKSVHGAPYIPAIRVGVQTVMASFSSVNGEKMHGNRPLLTGYLRDDLAFGGLVVGDWNGHGELEACTNTDCPQSLLAGLDIYMVPEDWRGLYENLLAQVEDGTIPMERLDGAVARILRVKAEYGLFDKPRPSRRELAGRWDLIGSAEHRDIARQAVRESLVLLKNDGVLPIRSTANVVVAGAAADDIAWQSGGWSITWQGGGALENSDFPGATSVFAGIAEAIEAAGGTVTLFPDDASEVEPDVAVVVFGERPYAEFVGDREDLAFRDEEGLDLLRHFHERDIPTVAVFLSGRPMWVNRELELADAFVAAWLPGTEGDGIADVLVGDVDGQPRYDFSGRLAFGWPGQCAPGGDLLFEFGEGSSYAQPAPAREFAVDCSLLDTNRKGQLRVFGRGLNPEVTASVDGEVLTNLAGTAGGITIETFDYQAQEDGRLLKWVDRNALTFSLPAGFSPSAEGSLVLTYSLEQTPNQPVFLRGTEEFELTSSLVLAAGKGWRTSRFPLACIGAENLGQLSLDAGAGFSLRIASISISPESFSASCEGPF